MNLQQWRDENKKGVELNLPSGLTVRCRRLGTFDLAFNGGIPKELDEPAKRFFNQIDKVDNIDQLTESARLIDLVVEKALVDPPDLNIAELPALDKSRIYLWCNGMLEVAPDGTFPPPSK